MAAENDKPVQPWTEQRGYMSGLRLKQRYRKATLALRRALREGDERDIVDATATVSEIEDEISNHNIGE